MNRRRRDWVPIGAEEMEANTGPIEIVVDRNKDDFKHFYYDDAYYEELRNQAFLNTFFPDDTKERKRSTGF